MVPDEKEYRPINNVFSFVKAFFNRSVKLEKTAPMTTVNTCYKKTVANETEEMGMRTWGADELGILKSRVKNVNKMLVHAFDEHCGSSIFTREVFST